MDALLTSLHALSLLPPSPSQLLQLLSNASTQEEEDKDVRDLARVLSLGSYDPNEIDGNTDSGFGIDRELIEDAVVEMIRTFKKDVVKCRAAYESEEEMMRSEKAVSLPKATPLKFLKLRHESALRQGEKVTSLYGAYRPRIVFSGGPSYSSTKNVSELELVRDLKSINLAQRLKGQYIIGKVASPISIYVGATFLLTLPDPLGFSIPIAISHFVKDPSMSSREASRLLPEGTLILIKEPYFSPHHALRVSGASGGVGIRVDTPTDVVVLPASGWAEEYTKDLKWPVESEVSGKGKGKNGKKVEVVPSGSAESVGTATPLWFAEGTCSTPTNTLQDIRDLLQDDRPGAAWRLLRRSQTSAVLPTDTPEIHELKGDILLALQSWSSAVEAYKSAGPSVSPKLTHATDLLHQSLHGPSTSGSTVSQIYHAHLSSSSPRIPVADWLSPSLCVAQIPNAGRGLVTTRAVPAGEPLLLAKSRGASYPPSDDCCPILRCDFQNGVLSTTTQVLATTNLIHIMLDRPEVCAEILGLTAGPAMEDSPWVKEGEFEKALAPVEEEEWVLDDRLGPKGGVNSLYVDEVLRHNAFGPGVISRQGEESRGDQQQDTKSTSSASRPPALARKLNRDPPNAFQRSTQPHPLPAILNHSCLPNVSSIFLGDVVLTKALRPLRAGEEISHEYVRGGTDYSSRQSLLSKHGFVCACPLCRLDRSDGEEQLAERRKIFAVQVPAVFGRSDALLSRRGGNGEDRENHRDIREALDELVVNLSRTYSATRGDLRPEMREVLERAGRHAVYEGNTGLGVSYLLQSLLSVNAKLSPEWNSIARRGSESVDTSLNGLSLSPSPSPLTEAPAIHVDEAQRTIWRLSQVFLASDNAPSSLTWSRAAYHTHDILIGGGYDVFRDRWGPTNQQEEETLDWIDAWRLWEREARD